MTLQEYALTHKEIFWDTPHPETLSDIVIQERYMQYGNWKDIQFLENTLGKDFRKNYTIIRNKKRQNLSKKTQNFFDKYLNV